MNSKTKKLTAMAMLCAISYAVMVVGRIPVISFLKYDPKDVVIAIGGLIYGPLSAFLISAVVSLIEMISVSDTGFIGLIMNILSTISFACTAAYIYKKIHTLKGALSGLVLGTILMTIVMLLWNYLITPLYLNFPREEVAKMLIPVFLPFNLLKAVLNSAFTLLLYKPVVTGLRKAGIISGSENKGGKTNTGLIIISAIIIITCILIILALNKII